jgi:hypothetical protein
MMEQLGLGQRTMACTAQTNSLKMALAKAPNRRSTFSKGKREGKEQAQARVALRRLAPWTRHSG